MTVPPPPPLQPESPKQVVTPPPELPATPRPTGGNPSMVATFEPRARFWFIVSAVFLVTGVYFGLTQMTKWASERTLVLSGTSTDAIVTYADASDVKGQRKKWNVPLTMEYVVGGKTITVTGTLSERPVSESIVIGEPVKIKYDSRNPERWTDRTVPQGFAHALIAVYLMVPIAVMTGLVGVWQRWRLLRTWRTGKLTAAAVLSVTSSPIAPGYTYVIVAPSGSKMGSIGVYVPRKLANPVRGDVIWLILPERGPALAARAFL